MKFKAAIFDMDGTLIDTLEDLADSMNIVLKRFGFPEHEVSAYRFFVGSGMEELVKRALPEDKRTPEIIKQGLQAMRDEYKKRWKNKSHLYEGIEELLDGLKAADLKLAILSNKPDDFTRQFTDWFLSKWSFDLVVGARPNVPKKPDPTAAIEIARHFGVLTEEVCYFGDTSIDMQTASAAGMYPVGVLWGFRSAEELIESGAKMLLTKPSVLVDWL